MKGLKKGISLITLVITIIVVIILAAAIILSIQKNSPIESASKAKFVNDLSEFKSELNIWTSNELSKTNGKLNIVNVNADKNGGTYNNLKITDIIEAMTDTYTDKLIIEKGKLVFIGTNEKEQEYAKEAGVDYKEETEPTEDGIIVSQIRDDNTTFDGDKNFAYSNPVIPAGFVAVDTKEAKWEELETKNSWNNGLVIQDTSGNQFIWVPIDGTHVAYEKDFSYPSLYGATSSNTSDDTFASDDLAANENTQIAKYHGFYIARYEASLDYNGGSLRAASKKSNGTVDYPNDWSESRDSAHNGFLWNYINYDDSKSYSESMDEAYGYSTAKVETALVTGTQWDSTMKWIQNAGYNVTTDSTSWGNYYNAEFTYDWPAEGNKPADSMVLLNIGATTRNRAKNIFDLAGNVWEWTSEKYSSSLVNRGGNCSYSGSNHPASCRGLSSRTVSDSDIGFRAALYIK